MVVIREKEDVGSDIRGVIGSQDCFLVSSLIGLDRMQKPY